MESLKRIKELLGVDTYDKVVAEISRLKSLETSNEVIYALSKMGVKPESVLKYHVNHFTEIKHVNGRIYVIKGSDVIEDRAETPENLSDLQKIYRPC